MFVLSITGEGTKKGRLYSVKRAEKREGRVAEYRSLCNVEMALLLARGGRRAVLLVGVLHKGNVPPA